MGDRTLGHVNEREPVDCGLTASVPSRLACRDLQRAGICSALGLTPNLGFFCTLPQRAFAYAAPSLAVLPFLFPDSIACTPPAVKPSRGTRHSFPSEHQCLPLFPSSEVLSYCFPSSLSYTLCTVESGPSAWACYSIIAQNSMFRRALGSS